MPHVFQYPPTLHETSDPISSYTKSGTIAKQDPLYYVLVSSSVSAFACLTDHATINQTQYIQLKTVDR